MLVDLTHIIYSGMPVFPGSQPPEIALCAGLGEEGYREHWLSFSSHTGTHIDAPAHVLQGGTTLDLMQPERFSGRGVKIDCSGFGSISPSVLEPFVPLLAHTDFLLFYTGWQDNWGSDRYFSGYPLLTDEAARLLCGMGLSGVGVDAPSFDAVDSADLPLHKILAGSGLLLVENLTHLDRLPEAGFSFFCMPLFISHSDGSPVRAFAQF